jgi:hypothetical protein
MGVMKMKVKKVMPRARGWAVPALVTGSLAAFGCGGGGPAPGLPPGPMETPPAMRGLEAMGKAMAKNPKNFSKVLKEQGPMPKSD